jgi:asparagine synthase (glutamine-hydrolysing)
MLRDPEDFSTMLADVRVTFDGQRQVSDSSNRAVRGMRVDADTYLPDDVLALNDKTTMAASVEGRVPLLDHRLVEFALSLAPEINMPGGRQKGLLRSVVKDILPTRILQQKKDGFSAPVVHWVTGPLLQPIRESLLGHPSGVVAEVVDLKRLEARMQRPDKVGPCSHSLFALFVLNIWCHTHVSGRSGN